MTQKPLESSSNYIEKQPNPWGRTALAQTPPTSRGCGTLYKTEIRKKVGSNRSFQPIQTERSMRVYHKLLSVDWSLPPTGAASLRQPANGLNQRDARRSRNHRRPSEPNAGQIASLYYFDKLANTFQWCCYDDVDMQSSHSPMASLPSSPGTSNLPFAS